MVSLKFDPLTSWLPAEHSNHYATEPSHSQFLVILKLSYHSTVKIPNDKSYSLPTAEYTLQSLTVLVEASKCGWEHQTKVFYLTTYPHIFHHIKYSPVIGFIAKVMSYFITITWAYRDLFIINISLAFIAAFRQINIELRASKGRDMMPDYYWKYRSIYMELRRLVNDFDDSINGIAMLAIGKNTFIICAHLFKSL